MGKTKLIILISTILILMTMSIICSIKFECEKDLPQIIQEKTLHVVTSNKPTDYFVGEDSISGFQYEILKHLADTLGLTLDIKVEPTLSTSIDGLKKGKYDIIARNILVTTKLRKRLNFSNPILLNKQVLIQRTDNEDLIRNQLNLAGKTIHVKRNSPSALRIKNLAQEMGHTIHLVELKNVENADIIRLVLEKKIDYTVCDQRVALLNKTPKLDIKTAIGFSQMEAWAFRKKSPQLEKAVNDFLDDFLETKAYQDIYNKYYQGKK